MVVATPIDSRKFAVFSCARVRCSATATVSVWNHVEKIKIKTKLHSTTAARRLDRSLASPLWHAYIFGDVDETSQANRNRSVYQNDTFLYIFHVISSFELGENLVFEMRSQEWEENAESANAFTRCEFSVWWTFLFAHINFFLYAFVFVAFVLARRLHRAKKKKLSFSVEAKKE